MALFDFFSNPFEGVISEVEYFFSEEFWARLFRIVMGSILIIIAIMSSVRAPVLWRR